MALKLTDQDAARLNDKQLANIIRKINAGKTPTARESAILAAARRSEEATTAPELPKSGYAKSWDDLATALSIDRRAIINIRQRHAKEIKERKLTRADGRHDIAAWAEFLEAIGTHGRGVNHPEGPRLDERTLRLRKLKFELDREEFKLAMQKSEMLEVAHFEHALGVMLAQFRQSLDALPARCAGLLGDQDIRNTTRELICDALKNLRSAKTDDSFMQVVELFIIRLIPEPDYHYRLGILSAEVELCKRTLRECKYMQPASDSQDKEPPQEPPDAESEE